MEKTNTEILSHAKRALSWLKDDCWCTWSAYGIDPKRETFYEYLSHGGMFCGANFMRLRVIARQIYVFSVAALEGYKVAEELVATGFSLIRTHAKLKNGGYAARFRADGLITDPTPNLYDHAFVLLAISSAFRLYKDNYLIAEAYELDEFISRRFRHPSGGFIESIPPILPRRQNPHMHLLEANLAAFEAFGDDLWLSRADEIIRLFFDHFYDWKTGGLPEYFDDNWSVLMQASRFRTEPGHHYEWVSLLTRYRNLGGNSVSKPDIDVAIDELHKFAEKFGSHPSRGWLIDEVWSDGTLRSGSSRLWPQTERLKAELCASIFSQQRVLKAFILLDQFRFCETPGLWQEWRDELGIGTSSVSPASSLYHITSALIECKRILL